MDWSDCPLVEIIPGKVSGAPPLKNTRLPVEAIIGNYDAFREDGFSPDAARAETLDCYPEAGVDAIKAILNYRAVRQNGELLMLIERERLDVFLTGDKNMQDQQRLEDRPFAVLRKRAPRVWRHRVHQTPG